MGDELARVISADGGLRAIAVVTTDLCEDARRRHETFPTATAALGRTLTAALLLAATIKRDERLSLELSGDGPLRGLLAEATPAGTVRGFAYRPKTDLPLRGGKLDVGGALGAGVLCVMRVPLATGSIYRSVVPLVSGEIGMDVAHYLATSEQTPSALGVGVLVGPDRQVVAAGGYLVQAMPGADPAVVERAEQGVVAAPSPSALVRDVRSPAEMLRVLLADVPHRVLDEHAVSFRCRCDPERVERAILAMGGAEIRALLQEGRPAEAVCEFCSTAYVVPEERLRLLLDS